MVISTQDNNAMELTDEALNLTLPINIIFGIAIFSVLYKVMINPSDLLFGLVVMTILIVLWYFFRSTRARTTVIKIDKKSNKLTVSKVHDSGRKSAKEFPLTTIESVTRTRQRLFYVDGENRFVTMYFRFIQTDDIAIDIWIESKRPSFWWQNYLTEEEKRIPEKVAKFLNIPLVD